MSLRIEVLSGLGDKAPAAILVEAEGRRLLLDAGGVLHPGQSLAWAEGLDVDAVLISHDHFDHIGGVSALPAELPLYCTPSVAYGCISALVTAYSTAATPAASRCFFPSTSRHRRVSRCWTPPMAATIRPRRSVARPSRSDCTSLGCSRCRYRGAPWKWRCGSTSLVSSGIWTTLAARGSRRC
ncbi:MBL fold metallo-hydrolase [Halomonas sp.]|uniref:MBL fold metallo-hydrolase n=1 Tax=Halomonas sp. TaxID=1486246 RepID=UPI0025BAE209|nr:MBL fold metallo-hydrolase [Halomonas sp.]